VTNLIDEVQFKTAKLRSHPDII